MKVSELIAEPPVIVITPTGRVQFVWDDDLAALCAEGSARIERAADVEPAPDGSGWMADCSRVGGGIYGPYPLRSLALSHERSVVTGRLVAGLLGEGIAS